MTEHTPGPWYLGGGPDGLVYGADNTVILPHSAEGFTTDTQRANARLIALAPELLRTLDNLLGALEYDKVDGKSGIALDCPTCEKPNGECQPRCEAKMAYQAIIQASELEEN